VLANNASVNLSNLIERVEDLQVRFQSTVPIRHVVVDGFLEQTVARKAMESFPAYHEMERKRNSFVQRRASEARLEQVDPVYKAIFDELRSDEFVAWLEGVTGVRDLCPTETMVGAGLHQSRNGGFHNIHLDANRDPLRGYYHRLNLIVYLNEGWRAGSPGRWSSGTVSVSTASRKSSQYSIVASFSKLMTAHITAMTV
jgi:Rps23 Pro-64 3,4-dihydroxylase Tpa1-like proline 4-hydroxylase